MELEATKAGEMHIVRVMGDVTGADVPAFAAQVQEILNQKGLNLVIDLESAGDLCDTVKAAFTELAAKLGKAGGALVVAGTPPSIQDILPTLKANPDVITAESRGLGMSILLNRISVRGQLLGFIRQALSTVYQGDHQPQPVTCRFVKHLQNFLVYALEPPYDGTLRKGMSLRFTMNGCGDEGTQTVSFDGLIYRFGTLKDGTPCLIVKVPDLLEISEDRREDPRLKVRIQVSFYLKETPERKGYGVIEDLSAEGALMRTSSFQYREGQLLQLEPEFRNHRLQEPIQYLVLHTRHEEGDVLVGGRFERIAGRDQDFIHQLILETSKW